MDAESVTPFAVAGLSLSLYLSADERAAEAALGVPVFLYWWWRGFWTAAEAD